MGLVQKAFSDIITFSRSSNATRVGPTGLVEYAPHNLLTYSEQFDNAVWVKSNVSVTANSTAAPNGTVTADKIIESAGVSTHVLDETISVTSGVTYTISAYLKKGERQYAALWFGAINSGAVIDLNAGTITAISGFNNPNSTSIVNVGNGWYRASVTYTSPSTTSSTLAIYLLSTNDFANRVYTGDGTSGIYLWGAQLSVGPYALDYTPTTSAAVYGPRFDYDGSGVTIVEPVSRNLLLYSQEFDNAAWGKSDSSVTANTTSSPDGTVTADTLAATAPGYASTFRTETVVSGNAYTLSVYAKANVTSTLSLEFRGSGSSPDATFNLSNGTVASGTGVISAVGNGWYRCSITKAAVDTSEIVIIGLGTSATIGNSIFIWGAQLEVGSTATGYMVSGATNGFRAVPVVSGSATARGLLVEEARTNLLTYSETFSNAAWIKSGATIQANDTTSPDGQVTASKLQETSATSQHAVYQGITSSGALTFSLFAKAAERSKIVLSMSDTITGDVNYIFDLYAGTTEVGPIGVGSWTSRSSAITQLGNGWYRCSVTGTRSGSGTVNAAIYTYTTALSYTGTTGSGVFIWGAQVE